MFRRIFADNNLQKSAYFIEWSLLLCGECFFEGIWERNGFGKGGWDCYAGNIIYYFVFILKGFLVMLLLVCKKFHFCVLCLL